MLPCSTQLLLAVAATAPLPLPLCPRQIAHCRSRRPSYRRYQVRYCRDGVGFGGRAKQCSQESRTHLPFLSPCAEGRSRKWITAPLVTAETWTQTHHCLRVLLAELTTAEQPCQACMWRRRYCPRVGDGVSPAAEKDHGIRPPPPPRWNMKTATWGRTTPAHCHDHRCDHRCCHRCCCRVRACGSAAVSGPWRH